MPPYPHREPARFPVAAVEYLEFFGCAADIWSASYGEPQLHRSTAQRRLQSLLAFARERSPLYRRLYAGLPARGLELGDLPVVDKQLLMSNFNDWVTQPDVTLQTAEAFVRDTALIGSPMLGRYAVWTSSGSTGTPAIFVQDQHSLAVYEALFAMRAGAAARRMLGAIAGGDRFALLAATEGHFAGVTMWARMRRFNPWAARQSICISVLLPTERIVAALMDFTPSVLTSYPTMLAVLAREQLAGRLHLRLAGVWSGGETLSASDRRLISEAFGCAVVDDYGASEFVNLAYDCGCGALHLNSDWALLEAVDGEHRPVPPGRPSATALLTNLANHVQPLIRYDLGDSITYLPGRCECGSHLPALRVEGRCDDTVLLANDAGDLLRVPPLALSTVIEERSGIYRFQVVEQAINRFLVRIDAADLPAARWPALSARLETCLRGYFAELGAPTVMLETVNAPMQIGALSGKSRRILVEV